DDVDLVDVRLAGHVVLRVLDVHPLLVLVPALQLVRTGADGLLGQVDLAAGRLARQHPEVVPGELEGEVGVGRAQRHGDRVLVGRRPRLDHADVTALLAPRLHGVEGADDVGRGELTPVDRRDVLERDALTQLERPRETVRRRGPTRGQIALEFVRAERYVLADLVVDQLAV